MNYSNSKHFPFVTTLVFSIVVVLVLSPKVAARDLLSDGRGSSADTPGCGNYYRCGGYGRGGGGNGCSHGCCGFNRDGRCIQCCNYANEVTNVNP
uniref:Glycine-rich protein n=1 Tax=Cucumis sativus TaxID=3659 RepID=A0A0A0K6K9_CUCSA